jgi:hypothetical protein
VNTATITLGGLVVGLTLIMREFLPVAWAAIGKGKAGKGDGDAPASGKFDPKAHVPFFAGTGVGMLAISTPGGIIGAIAAKVLGISNALGDKALAAGVGGATTSVTRHGAAQLSIYGSAVVLLLVIAIIILRKKLAKPQKRQLGAGLWCGVTLGLSSAAAGLTASVLIPAVEQLGHALGGAA